MKGKGARIDPRWKPTLSSHRGSRVQFSAVGDISGARSVIRLGESGPAACDRGTEQKSPGAFHDVEFPEAVSFRTGTLLASRRVDAAEMWDGGRGKYTRLILAGNEPRDGCSSCHDATVIERGSSVSCRKSPLLPHLEQ